MTRVREYCHHAIVLCSVFRVGKIHGKTCHCTPSSEDINESQSVPDKHAKWLGQQGKNRNATTAKPSNRGVCDSCVLHPVTTGSGVVRGETRQSDTHVDLTAV